MAPSIRIVGQGRARLGESPVWDDGAQCLWWVDAVAGRLLATADDGEPRGDWRLGEAIGSIGLSDDGLVAAMADGFAHIGRDGRTTRLWSPPSRDPNLRFNDGKMDRAGRFLAGQIEHHGGSVPSAGLWRLAPGGGTAMRLAGGFRLVNAICFSPAGDRLYVADSLEGVIRVHDYATDAPLGALLGTIDCRPHGSGPDGATVDRDGNLWVVLVLAGAVACFAPDGRLLRRVELPLPFPSCPAFGGPGLETLFVTTIADSGNRLKSDHPDAGRLLAIDGLGTGGIAEARWRAAWMPGRET